MSNHASTKVRRRHNSKPTTGGNGIHYKCGRPNTNPERPRPVAKCPPFVTLEERHGKDHPKLAFFKALQRGTVRA